MGISELVTRAIELFTKCLQLTLHHTFSLLDAPRYN
jgi:hypothetical protein